MGSRVFQVPASGVLVFIGPHFVQPNPRCAVLRSIGRAVVNVCLDAVAVRRAESRQAQRASRVFFRHGLVQSVRFLVGMAALCGAPFGIVALLCTCWGFGDLGIGGPRGRGCRPKDPRSHRRGVSAPSPGPVLRIHNTR